LNIGQTYSWQINFRSAQVRRNLAYSGSAFAPESGLLVGEQSPEAAPVTCMKSNLTVQFLPLI
jgi:hypothetical protein